jgi:hypothetical protein
LELVVDSGDDRVGAHLFNIGLTEFVQVRRTKLQPSRKRIAPDHTGSQRTPFLARVPMINCGIG